MQDVLGAALALTLMALSGVLIASFYFLGRLMRISMHFTELAPARSELPAEAAAWSVTGDELRLLMEHILPAVQR